VSRAGSLVARILFCLGAASALLGTVRAQQDTSRFAAIVESARRELQETHTPGAALALVEGDRMVFSTGIGVTDVESSTPMRADMVFRLGSTTKMFTAAALVTLAEEGRLSLDAPIASVVKGLDRAIARLTASQLLSHTAGLRDDSAYFGKQDDEALGNGIRAMRADMLFTEPASIYSYSNPGYWIAGFVVEEITNTPYADAMQERVFAPLGMTRSTFRPMMAMTYPLAHGHEGPARQPATVIRPAANNVATWPAGSMFSNVHDLSRFVIAFMNGGRIDGRDALKAGVIAKLTEPHAAIPGGADAYGYGLQVAKRADVTVVSHGGSRSGYGSTILMVPSRRAGVIVLGNRTGSGLPRTARRALETLLGAKEGALVEPSGSAAAAGLGANDLSAWAGRYSQGPGNPIELMATQQGLRVRYSGREFTAKPQGPSRLLLIDGDGNTTNTLVLVADAAGKPAYLFTGGRAYRRLP
jgi:CubicO group peptidase (beta-lactamase class C family)